MTRFIIVRHGETKGTKQQKYFGRTDMPLSGQGVRQIRKTKENINNYHFNYIYTSPLKRCTETAGILQKGKTKIKVINDLIEIDFGKWEGLTLTQMQKRYPKKFNSWLYNFQYFKMPGGESVSNMIKRVGKFWESILRKHKTGNILIVTHGGPAKAIIMKTLGLSMNNFWHLNISTGSVSVIESFNGNPVVQAVNIWGK